MVSVKPQLRIQGIFIVVYIIQLLYHKEGREPQELNTVYGKMMPNASCQKQNVGGGVFNSRRLFRILAAGLNVFAPSHTRAAPVPGSPKKNSQGAPRIVSPKGRGTKHGRGRANICAAVLILATPNSVKRYEVKTHVSMYLSRPVHFLHGTQVGHHSPPAGDLVSTKLRTRITSFQLLFTMWMLFVQGRCF